MEFTTKNYDWSLKGLKHCISDNFLESEIIAETKNTAIVHVKSYKDSVILGAVTAWCISQHDCSWEQYVKKENNYQIFIYDFSKTPSSELSVVGATFNSSAIKLNCCFTIPNNPIGKTFGFGDDDMKALKERVLKPCFGKNFSIEKVIENDINEENSHEVTEVTKPESLTPNEETYSHSVNDYIYNDYFYYTLLGML